MQREEILQQLVDYVAKEILDGQDDDLDGETPLLEWGIINSMEITRMLAFIKATFGVEIPGEQVLPTHFQDLNSVTDLVVSAGAS